MSHNHNKPHLHIFDRYDIPTTHLEKNLSHAHSHGGQNVNKVATKVQLKLNLKEINLNEEYNEKLNTAFPQGFIEVVCQETRHQHKNLEIALKKLQHQIESALA